MASGKRAARGTKSTNVDDEDVVYTGHALQIAAGWLGIGDVEAELQKEEGTEPAAATVKPRNRFAGLGSIPSARKQGGFAGVEHRLGRKVLTSAKARTGDRQQGSPFLLQTHRNGARNGVSGGGDENEASSSDSEGRGGAVGKGKKREAPCMIPRTDLLASARAKKRQKHNKGGENQTG